MKVLNIRTANTNEALLVSDILIEAAAWLEECAMPMWQLNELTPELILSDVTAGLFALAWDGNEAAGTVKFELEDPIFWPEVAKGDAAYIHRLAVRRRYAGRGISTALLEWSVAETRRAGRRFLRLDCEVSRPRLRRVYESFGFSYHSDRAIGPYMVARYEFPVT